MADTELSEYERIRLQRIQQNKAFLGALNIQSPPTKPKETPPPKKRKVNEPVVYDGLTTPQRRSGRIQSKPTIEYSKVESQFDSDESSSEDSRPKQKRRKRIEKDDEYDFSGDDDDEDFAEDGAAFARDDLNIDMVASKSNPNVGNVTQCHQCHKRDNSKKAVCTSCSLNFCQACMKRYYRELIKAIAKDLYWICPACRKVCTCKEHAKDRFGKYVNIKFDEDESEDSSDSDGDPGMYYVQSIHDTKVENVRITPLTRDKTMYLVKWEGWDDPKDNMWMAASLLVNCEPKIQEYTDLKDGKITKAEYDELTQQTTKKFPIKLF